MKEQSEKLAVSLKAANEVFMTIAASTASVKFKGRLMAIAAEMMKNPSAGYEKEFSSLPGGAEIYRMILTAAERSRRARAAAATRRSRHKARRKSTHARKNRVMRADAVTTALLDVFAGTGEIGRHCLGVAATDDVEQFGHPRLD